MGTDEKEIEKVQDDVNVVDVDRELETLLSINVLLFSTLWYGFSVSLVVYNKWLLNDWQGGFKFPLLMSSIHMILKLIFSTFMIKCKKYNFHISKKTLLQNAVPIGITTALDIAASNASYLYISIPLYTIIKSSSVLFVLLFSILYKLQPCQKDIILSTVIISLGIALAVYGEANFSLFGSILVLGASAIGGYRWALTQVLMNKIGLKLDSVVTLYLISPSAALTLIPFFFFIELQDFTHSIFISDKDIFLKMILNLLGSGIFAVAMIFVELALIKHTSSLSMAVISYVKQFIQIVLSILVFHSRVTALNIIGLFVVVVGLFYYSWIKSKDLQRQEMILGEGEGFQEFQPLGKEIEDEKEDQVFLS
eukprot:maker-scaffold_4-snap-gene-1.38-mRNA-1 protein AED:0.14 eAED:0.14 QI:33/0.83/0.85/1/1/1/7/718/365